MKQELILMMGGQGSGKGTLSKKFLTENPHFEYVETGATLRALPDNHPLKAIMARGEFVPDEDLQNLLMEKIKPTNSVVLDGFPRQLSQAKWLVDTLSYKFDTIAVYLNISRDLMQKRIQQRIKEGGGRADDADNAVVQKRLDSFFNKTMPAINWLSINPNIKFADVQIKDAPIETNYQTMMNALKPLRTR
jgi:adenylate kinase